ncbi:MAG: 2-oxoglutarate dehydrogenase E1 component [Longimicrobiales bacterium]
MKRSTLFDTYNAAYVQSIFDQYLQNPGLVDEAWQRLFESGAAGAAGLLGAAPTVMASVPTEAQLLASRAAGELVDAYRLHGHRAARLDPLGAAPPGHPQLDPRFHGITPDQLASVPASMVGLEEWGATIADVVDWLATTYTGSIGYEFEYLEDPEQREWLREQIESAAHRPALAVSEKRRLLERLTDVETFEQFLHRAYLGAKRFSVEGTDMLLPMLDLAIERAADSGAAEIVIGMAHRGRLNVIAHVLGMPYADLLGRFEGRHAGTAGTGDVKYHIGAEGTYATRSGHPLTVLLAPNPSHLEFVNPIVEGMTRAKQSNRYTASLERDENLVVPILIHGDAAFVGQGVVTETLNLARLAGYRTGGTLHIIANNQVGFTTGPNEARSADYASDPARGFDIPVFHVNADDPEACLAVVRLAMAFRNRFHGDVVIDLVGYRRFGHNEGDEPAYTQPVMYHRISQQPTVRQLWADRLAAEKSVDPDTAAALVKAAHDRLVAVQDEIRKKPEETRSAPVHEDDRPADHVDTTVNADALRALDRHVHAWPDGFHVNPKLARQLDRRARILTDGDGPIDWAHAEVLAFASLLQQGVPLRLSGQDTERGTFSQRHLVLHGVETDAEYIPLAHLDGADVTFEIHNSPLSELAAMGFEYGYSVVAPRALVLWEAQFGDFANGGQVIIDQFVAAGREKWGQRSRLVLLLPHGYEGQGPEHSSARLERFLQLAAEDNLRIANCTTPAQYFHLLRRQALNPVRRPLVIMTPKSLLRHPRAVSTLPELASGRFYTVIADPAFANGKASARRVVLASGKLYHDLLAGREKAGPTDVAFVRVEQLYPFPVDALAEVLAEHDTDNVVWAQEEPRNMGAWAFVEPRLRELIGASPVYVGRPERASPAEGYAEDHEREQQRIVAEALAPSQPRARASRPRSRQKSDKG